MVDDLEWEGSRLREALAICKPLPGARYARAGATPSRCYLSAFTTAGRCFAVGPTVRHCHERTAHLGVWSCRVGRVLSVSRGWAPLSLPAGRGPRLKRLRAADQCELAAPRVPKTSDDTVIPSRILRGYSPGSRFWMNRTGQAEHADCARSEHIWHVAYAEAVYAAH